MRKNKGKEGEMEESGEERFRRIDHRVRSILQHNKHLPLVSRQSSLAVSPSLLHLSLAREAERG